MAASTILVVDGDLASRNYIATALQKEGHRVLQAASGKEGLIAAWRDRPDLIIVEPILADLPGEDLAARLRSDARTASLPLVALSKISNPQRIQDCKAAGFNEYLVKGPDVVPSLIRTVTMLLSGEEAGGKVGGLLLAFLSAKGGTGTSSLCANLGRNIAISDPEARVVVVDLVLPIGSISGIVGYQGEPNVVTISGLPAAQATPEFLRSRVPRVEQWNFNLLAGAPDPEQGNELNVGRMGELVAGLRASYDYVLLDLGRSLSRISLPLIEHADLVVMVLGADVSTVALSKIAWEYLQSKGLEAVSVFPVLNRSVGLEGLTKAEIEKTLGLPIRTSIPYVGGAFSMANNQHQPYCLKFPSDTASIMLKDTARLIVETAKQRRAA
jgi:pilus assembly protein CpaE